MVKMTIITLILNSTMLLFVVSTTLDLDTSEPVHIPFALPFFSVRDVCNIK